MKTSFCVILLAAIAWCLTGCGKRQHNETPEQFAQSMFRALQDNDVKAYLQLCADKDDYLAFVKSGKSPDESLDREIQRAERKYGDSAKLARDRSNRFEEVVAQINWKKARLGNIASEIETDESGRKGYGMMRVEIEYQGAKLILAIDDVVLTPNGFLSLEDRGVVHLEGVRK